LVIVSGLAAVNDDDIALRQRWLSEEVSGAHAHVVPIV
jgi:hypothetical protein